jgi:hypothetical protein
VVYGDSQKLLHFWTKKLQIVKTYFCNLIKFEINETLRTLEMKMAAKMAHPDLCHIISFEQFWIFFVLVSFELFSKVLASRLK